MKKLSNLNTEDKYIKAKKRVEDLKGFYSNLISYCLVIPFIISINYRTSWDFHWFWFPLLGWGIGLGFHACQVFVNDGFLGRKWEEKKIQELIDKEENKRWN